MLDTIIAERIEKFEREKLLLEQVKEQKDREFDLEKLRLEHSLNKNLENITVEYNNVQNKSKELAKILRSFDASNTNTEISTFWNSLNVKLRETLKKKIL